MDEYRPIEEFFKSVQTFDRESFEEMAEALERLTWSITSSTYSPATKAKSLLQIAAYLKKKADELDPEIAATDGRNLRRLRNDFAHGKTHKGKDLSSMYPALWKAISKLGRQMPPRELEDLLAYSIGVDNLSMHKRNATTTQVIAVYKQLFNALDLVEKRRVFGGMLLRLFSESTLPLLGPI